MNAGNTMPVLLLLLFSFALSAGAGMIVLIIRLVRARPAVAEPELSLFPLYTCERTCYSRRPNCWLAVKSGNLHAVQSALGLHHAKACSWMEGLEEKLFIAPPVKGWILVIGSGLPDPSEDVDVCFRFVLELSRKLGQVQFFSASRILHHHAWVQANSGRVIRAYAWAGKTLWQQGLRTRAERELDLRCFDYAEPAESNSSSQMDAAAANVEKVPLLAARWSLDPAGIDERFLESESGIAGESSRRY